MFVFSEWGKKTTNKNIDLVDLESKSGNKVMHSNFIRLNKQQIVDSSKLCESADHNCEFNISSAIGKKIL